VIRIEYPGKLVSALNAREHHMARSRRVKAERLAARIELQRAIGGSSKPPLPLAITVTRIAPRALDAHDNLGASCKGTIDSIAAFFGVADNDPRITFRTAQERGRPRHYAVRIEIEARP